MRNWVLFGVLIDEQLIEIGASFQGFFVVVEKDLLKIIFEHHLLEMYLLHEKAQPLSFHYAQRRPSFPLICRVIDK